MKLETFFEKFDLFADAPGAVAKMRELVLELGVTGQFFGTAGWQPAQLVDVCEKIHYGYTAKANHLINAVRLLRITDIQNSRVAWEKVPGCEITDNELPKYLLRSGDILIARTGGTVGKSFLVQGDPPTSVFASYLIRLVPSPAVLPTYLKRFLESPPYWHQLFAGARGAAQPNVNGQTLAQIDFLLPPLPEQKRIVAKVDELMALCDRLEAQQQERETRHAALARASLARFAEAPTPANLQFLFHSSFSIHPSDLRKSILTLAVQGKLVPQDPTDEPADEWIQTVCKVKPGTLTECGEPPFALPERWTWLRVESVFEVAGGIQKTPHRAPRNNSFPYLGVGNVYRGRLDLTNLKRFELEPGEVERRRLETGDLLIIEGNGSFNEIGRCAKWNGEIKNCVHQNHVIRCRPIDTRMSDFVLLFLNSPNGMEIMQRLAITSSGLYSLSVGKIRQIEIPIPPLAEQRRIVAKVDELMVLVDALESKLATARTTATSLLSAAIHELTRD